MHRSALPHANVDELRFHDAHHGVESFDDFARMRDVRKVEGADRIEVRPVQLRISQRDAAAEEAKFAGLELSCHPNELRDRAESEGLRARQDAHAILLPRLPPRSHWS